MFPRPSRLWALLCLVLVLQLAAAQSFAVVVRAESDAPATTSAPPEPKSTKARDDDKKTNEKSSAKTDASDVTASHATASHATASRTKARSSTASATSSAIPTIIATDGPLDNSTFLNTTIPAGQLPLQPEVTPGWAVAGVIMLVTGVVYALVGIKNRWIHTFFSTAYVTALGISVLIVYVMNVPVSDAIQGAYVVAIVMSGCALGAASMFFKELTEGLGCALGGFCLSMWLLCLVPGGLLRPVTAKAIFIACFTLVGFAFYFSRWTRDWALIILISFGGATVTVLGIDCFSRAGLKEFWAYVWDLNEDLFPLGADTYPVTKGIRVETAAIIVVFLVGIISQVKLWRIVREQREKRAADRAEGQRNLDDEEENVGRQIEHATARDRRRWERTYGDRAEGSVISSRESGTGNTEGEKRLRDSRVASGNRDDSAEVIEMADMSESSQSHSGPDGLMASEDAQDGKVTVRVAADDVPEYPVDGDDAMNEKTNPFEEQSAADLKRHSRGSKRASRTQPTTETPEVVPLPFTVPANDDDAGPRSERSSVATFADEETATAAAPAAVQRHSLVNRLSHGSMSLLRNLSQRSARTNGELPHEFGESSEELVIPKSHRRDDDNGSLAATVDDESVSGDGRMSALSAYDVKNIEINADLGEGGEEQKQDQNQLKVKKQRPTSGVTAATDKPPLDPATASKADVESADLSDNRLSPASEKPKSIASMNSTPVSLTQGRLPQSLSRVAMSYRTNEWAKHLSHADAPEQDELHIAEPAKTAKSKKEKSAPVDVEDLRRTAVDGAPAPAIRRSESQVSQVSNAKPASRSGSRQGPPPNLSIPSPGGVPDSPSRSPSSPMMGNPMRPSSAALRRASSAGFQPIAEEGHAVPAQDVIPEGDESISRPASISPSLSQSEAFQRAPVPGVMSYASPQTLIGQRDLFLRNKSQGSLVALSPDQPGVMPSPQSESGSMHNFQMYNNVPYADADDLPLSQRKNIMRQGSLMSLAGSNVALPRVSSGIEASDKAPFNSHQPQRNSTAPTQFAREAQLANFRQSVSQDLRSGTPLMTPSGRETPFASTNSLLIGRESEVQRNIEMQRSVMMGQKAAEAQKKEWQKREREWADKAFDDRMRSGDLLDAHRDAMRKMQNGTKRRG